MSALQTRRYTTWQPRRQSLHVGSKVRGGIHRRERQGVRCNLICASRGVAALPCEDNTATPWDEPTVLRMNLQT